MSTLIKLKPNLVSIHFIHLQQYPCKFMHMAERVNKSNFSTRQFSCSDLLIAALFVCLALDFVGSVPFSFCMLLTVMQSTSPPPVCLSVHSSFTGVNIPRKASICRDCASVYTRVYFHDKWVTSWVCLCVPVLTRDSFERCQGWWSSKGTLY